MNILVTGGGGFLGQAIVRALVARGDQVRSFTRSEYPALTELGVEQRRGDLADRAAVLSACEGCDAVIHAAAMTGAWGKPAAFWATNVQGSQNIVDACRAHGIRHLVHTSTPSVVSCEADLEGVDESQAIPEQHLAEYPRTKAEAERRVRAACDDDLATVSLRPHLIWGPGDTQLFPRIIDRARSGKLRRVGAGDNLVDITYIDDAVSAHLLALDALMDEGGRRACVAGKAYFISSGEPIALWTMVDHMLAAAELGPCTRSIPRWAAYAAGSVAEFAYRSLDKAGEPVMTRWVATELATAHWFDISAAREDLGFRPETELKEGLARLAAWYKHELAPSIRPN